jgi:CubicO group peptidase (beta-lactamase class C family)
MKQIFFFITVIFFSGSLLAQQPAQMISNLLSQEKDFSGVVLYAENGKTTFLKAVGFRNYNTREPLQTTDIFELASVSKQFTSMIIMMLQEEGMLQYDDPVEKFLDIPYKGITIRHLLTHTSGLPDYQAIMDAHWDKSKVAGNKEILEYLNQYSPPKNFEPGTKYEYSNTGYVLLASIAEKASGKDFIALCRSRIFTPLDMQSTDIRTLEKKASTENFALGHIYVKESERFVRADSFPSSDYTIWLGNRKGPGRISSTAEDLLKWDQALYSAKLVKSKTLEQAYTPGTITDGSLINYGFGWMLKSNAKGEKVIWHSGDNPGYKTRIMRYPATRQTLIVLCNNAYPEFESMMNKLEKAIGTF